MPRPWRAPQRDRIADSRGLWDSSSFLHSHSAIANVAVV
jgi:hypothetical protein